MGICINCNKEEQHKSAALGFCRKCYLKQDYQKKKKQYALRHKKWRDKNNKHYRAKQQEYMKKFISSGKLAEYRKYEYQINKQKYTSRKVTQQLIFDMRVALKLNLQKDFYRCEFCGSDKIEIHHETYPTARKDILNAIKKGKIYFLCRKHHSELHAVKS